MIDVLPAVPINEAEAILEPFWAAGYSGFKQWRFQPGEGSGAEINEMWAHVTFAWAQAPDTGPAFGLDRTIRVDCDGYDHLVLRAQIPDGAVLHLRATTEHGVREQAYTDDSNSPREFSLSLNGATRLDDITIAIDAGSNRQGAGNLYWLGLSNAAMLEHYHARWERLRRQDWGDTHVKSAEFIPSFTPTYGLFIDTEALAHFREQMTALGDQNPFLEVRDRLLASEYRPESDIADYIGTYWEILTRDRDARRISRLVGPGSSAALAGLVLQDARLLRLAARYALSIAACEHWIDGFPCTFHGCEFETKAFNASYAMWEIALIMDLAGECITYWGNEYLRRQLADKGLGFTNYVSWRWDYVHSCNQLALFSRGRLSASLLLERDWSRMRPYTELAIQELNKSMENVILPDGSFVEGPGYLTGTLSSAIPPYLLYARARGVAPETVLPAAMRNSADYIEAFMATDESTDYLATNECGEDVSRTGITSAALLAAALPNTHWVTVFHKVRARTPNLPADLMYWSVVSRIPEEEPPRRNFVHLREGGFISSLRDLNGEPVRIFIMGNRANSGHCHEDKGSFILEFAGDTFAMDSNCYRYDSVYVTLLKQCDRHNMLVPYGAGEERPHPQNPIPVDVHPEGHGDETTFTARIDAAPGWEMYYQRWERHWDSPTPGVLEIRDNYALTRGEGVEFLWNTRLPIRLENGGAVVDGARGRARITWPADCTARVEALPSPPGRAHNRLAIRRPGAAGELLVRIILETSA